jgi:SAM-dependent methyltransferase
MRILILDTYYPRFLSTCYAARPHLARAPYREQWRALMDQCFGTADFYSRNLNVLGHEVEELVVNCLPLQRQWAREHRPSLSRRAPLHRLARQVDGWLTQVAAAQIDALRPDVLYVQDLNATDPALLRYARSQVRLVAGQIACPLDPATDLAPYDVLFTSFRHYVDMFRGQGLRGEYLRIGFEPSILDRLGPVSGRHAVTFVGGVTAAHREGTRLLETVAVEIPVECWGYGVDALAGGSPLRRHHHGEAWGLDMYRALAASRITLNRHIDVAGRFANNMRLFEATGVGACLLTDAKENLATLLTPGKEVLVYRDAAECVEILRHYLAHEEARAAVAKAGQARTLAEHTYARRMQELSGMLEGLVRQVSRRPSAAPRPGRLRVCPLPGRIPGASLLRPIVGRLRHGRTVPRISDGHRIIAAVPVQLTEGWKDRSIPERQRRLVDGQLRRMYQREVVPVFRVAADAVAATGAARGTILEVGCASGYYFEVFSHLLGGPIRYVGVDYSINLLMLGRQRYPGVPFLVGDATRLPVASRSCDLLFSGTVLLHVPDYARVVEESARVTRDWCIFHRTPVVASQATTFLSKFAYATPVVEIVFNEPELLGLMRSSGLDVVHALELDAYSLAGISERIRMLTYICRRAPAGRGGSR